MYTRSARREPEERKQGVVVCAKLEGQQTSHQANRFCHSLHIARATASLRGSFGSYWHLHVQVPTRSGSRRMLGLRTRTKSSFAVLYPHWTRLGAAFGCFAGSEGNISTSQSRPIRGMWRLLNFLSTWAAGSMYLGGHTTIYVCFDDFCERHSIAYITNPWALLDRIGSRISK